MQRLGFSPASEQSERSGAFDFGSDTNSPRPEIVIPSAARDRFSLFAFRVIAKICPAALSFKIRAFISLTSTKNLILIPELCVLTRTD